MTLLLSLSRNFRPFPSFWLNFTSRRALQWRHESHTVQPNPPTLFYNNVCWLLAWSRWIHRGTSWSWRRRGWRRWWGGRGRRAPPWRSCPPLVHRVRVLWSRFQVNIHWNFRVYARTLTFLKSLQTFTARICSTCEFLNIVLRNTYGCVLFLTFRVLIKGIVNKILLHFTRRKFQLHLFCNPVSVFKIFQDFVSHFYNGISSVSWLGTMEVMSVKYVKSVEYFVID